VVEAVLVERVEQRETALDLMHFDHALEDVLDRDTLTLVPGGLRQRGSPCIVHHGCGSSGLAIRIRWYARRTPCRPDGGTASMGMGIGGGPRTYPSPASRIDFRQACRVHIV